MSIVINDRQKAILDQVKTLIGTSFSDGVTYNSAEYLSKINGYAELSSEIKELSEKTTLSTLIGLFIATDSLSSKKLELLNSFSEWASGHPAPSCYKNVFGEVFLKGTIKAPNSSSNTVITTLPAGFRPLTTVDYTVIKSSTPALLRINGLGDVFLTESTTAGQWISLEGVRFTI